MRLCVASIVSFVRCPASRRKPCSCSDLIIRSGSKTAVASTSFADPAAPRAETVE
jgi:hypothetical protein